MERHDYELNVTPELFTILQALQNENHQKIFQIDNFIREQESEGLGVFLKLRFDNVNLPKGCRFNLLDRVLRIFKKQGYWEAQPLVDALRAYLEWNQSDQMKHIRIKFAAIVISFILGVFFTIFVLQPLGWLSFGWIAVFAFPVCMATLQELTQFYFSRSHHKTVEQALLLEVAKNIPAIENFSTESQNLLFTNQTQAESPCSTTSRTKVEGANQIIVHAVVHANDQDESDCSDDFNANTQNAIRFSR